MKVKIDTAKENYLKNPLKLGDLLAIHYIDPKDIIRLLNQSKAAAFCEELNTDVMLRNPIVQESANSSKIKQLRISYSFLISPFDKDKTNLKKLIPPVYREIISAGEPPYELHREQYTFSNKNKSLSVDDIFIESDQFHEFLKKRFYIRKENYSIVFGDREFQLENERVAFNIILKIYDLTKQNNKKWVKKAELKSIIGEENLAQSLEKRFGSKKLKELRKIVLMDNGEKRKSVAYRLHPFAYK